MVRYQYILCFIRLGVDISSYYCQTLNINLHYFIIIMKIIIASHEDEMNGKYNDSYYK